MDSSISLTTPAAPTLPPSPGTLADRISSLGERARAGEAGARGELSRACEMLEAHFVTWLLREMRATVPQDDGLLPRDASNETYDALFDDSLARTIAHGGMSRDLEAELGKLFGEERRIRVGDSPCHPLAADGENLRGHFCGSAGGPALGEAEGSPGPRCSS